MGALTRSVFFLTIFLTTTSTVYASLPCCNGENKIINRRCSDGSDIKISCQKYLFNNKTTKGRIDENDNLIVLPKDHVVEPDRYCKSQFNGSNEDIYLICFDEDSPSRFMFILEFISVLFIIITILVYFQLPDLLDLQGICIIHSISGLAVSFLVIGLQEILYVNQKWMCMTAACIMYFSILYAFFWLNALAFHIWRINARPNILDFTKYWGYISHIYGIGGPAVLLIILLIAHHSPSVVTNIHPGLGEVKCWFKTDKSQFIFLYIPILLLICFNIIYYVWTIIILWKNLANIDQQRPKVMKYRLMLCIKLFFIMGISWIFEVLSGVFEETHPAIKVIWLIMDCINALQGFLLFLVLVVFRKRVVRGLANRNLCGIKMPSKWRTVEDDECEEIEEEFRLSETQINKS